MTSVPRPRSTFPSLSRTQSTLRSLLSAAIISASFFRDSTSTAFAIPSKFSQCSVTSHSSKCFATQSRKRHSIDRIVTTPSKRRHCISTPSRGTIGLRAGAGTELTPSDRDYDRQRLRKEKVVSVSLAAAYFSVMGAKCALPAVLPLLLSPSIGLSFPPGAEPQQLFARQLTVATLAVALGKVLLGPVIDHLGGRLSLKIALACLASLLGTISVSQSFVVFTCCWILIDFCFSSCWAACLNAIHESFNSERWGKEIGNLATAARAGNSLAFATFSWVLSIFQKRGMRQYWRPVFVTATVAQLIPLLMLLFIRRPNVSQNEVVVQKPKPSIRSSLRILQKEGRTVDFWLHLTSRSVLMLFASFLLFVPTFMSSVFDLSSAGGAQVGSLYALGCLLSVSTLSEMYPKLRRRARCWAVTWFLLVGATGSSLTILGHVLSWWTLPPTVCALLFFLWGFSFSVPFYLPPSIYALSRGGDDGSATIADAFDIGGFGLLALFNGYVASINHTKVSCWAPTFLITTICSFISFLSLMLATSREEQTF